MLNKKITQVRDFYYNTWTRLISVDVSAFKYEIMELHRKLSKEGIMNTDFIVKEICAMVTSNHQSVLVNQKYLNKYVRKLLTFESSDTLTDSNSSQSNLTTESISCDSEGLHLIIYDLIE